MYELDYLDGLHLTGYLRQGRVNALRELQSASGEELSTAQRKYAQFRAFFLVAEETSLAAH